MRIKEGFESNNVIGLSVIKLVGELIKDNPRHRVYM